MIMTTMAKNMLLNGAYLFIFHTLFGGYFQEHGWIATRPKNSIVRRRPPNV
jgi:hypothetical protein